MDQKPESFAGRDSDKLDTVTGSVSACQEIWRDNVRGPAPNYRIVKSSSFRSDTNMCPGEWVMTSGSGTDVAAS